MMSKLHQLALLNDSISLNAPKLSDLSSIKKKKKKLQLLKQVREESLAVRQVLRLSKPVVKRSLTPK